jgi:glycosyltransferase involved in cell wall biosynthesis
MSKLTAYIIAYNEAAKIRAAIESVSWADEVLVVDSHSTDGTTEIAQSMGARIVQVPFIGFGDLRNQAIAACTHDWIFSLDSDERCTDEVRDEILDIIKSDDSSDVYFIPRKNFFMGRWIKHSGYYPDYRQPQLFRKGALKYTLLPVHEGFELQTSKPPCYLTNPIWQMPFRNLEEILHKANRYSSLGAAKLEAEGKSSGMTTALIHGLWAFIQHFFLKMGFLDGWAGFVIALGNFEGAFYKYAKLHDRTANWKPPDPE